MNTPNQQPGTHHGLVPGFLPMSPQDGLDQFRVSGTMAVRSLLRELQGAREHVVLYAHADDELHLVTRIEGLEANDFRLGFPGDEESLEALLEARSLTLVGLTNAVKIQLDIPAVSLREDEGRRQLIAAIPSMGGTSSAARPSAWSHLLPTVPKWPYGWWDTARRAVGCMTSRRVDCASNDQPTTTYPAKIGRASCRERV